MKRVVFPILWVIALAQVVLRRLRIIFGGAELEPDFANVWHPLAQTVADGTPLYTSVAVDNKPPIFHAINLLTYYISPEYHATLMLLVVGVSNALLATLLYEFVSRESDWNVAFVAAAVFLLILPLVKGNVINVRTVAMVGVFVALLIRHPLIRGVAIAIGVLISQYAVLGIPLIMYQYLEKSQWQALGSFVIGGAATAIFTLGGVWAVFGTDSMLASLYWSFGIPVVEPSSLAVTPTGTYFTGTSSASLFSPLNWAGFIAYRGMLLSPILLFVLAGIAGWYHERILPTQWIVMLSIFLLPLLVRSYASYWLYATPFIAAVSALGLRLILSSKGPFITELPN